MLILENTQVRVGVAPKAGGRVVLLQRRGGANVLKVAPALLGLHRWHGKVTPRSRFASWHGHTVWLGPQCHWWTQQEFVPSRRRQRAVWPPDPYVDKAAYTVVHHDVGRLVMRGEASPVSGVRLEKTIAIAPGGRVRFSVVATNTSPSAVSWDLWQNMRVDGYTRCYVPLGAHRQWRMEGPPGAQGETVDHCVDGGYFSFVPRPPSPRAKNRQSKAFLHPDRGLIAAFTKEDLLLIRFSCHRPSAIHPAQALVELYNQLTHEPGEALLELECHAPYRTLQPGESMGTEQTWELMPYGGGDTPAQHRAFLRSVPL